MSALIIREKLPNDPIPWDLLLLADPSREEINTYLSRGTIHLAFLNDSVVGETVLTTESDNTIELKNIAVEEKQQGKGIGKQLIFHAINFAKLQHASRIEVGTGNSSQTQLLLYQKCGFQISRIKKDFFKEHYKQKIFENGIQCVDKIYLDLVL